MLKENQYTNVTWNVTLIVTIYNYVFFKYARHLWKFVMIVLTY